MALKYCGGCDPDFERVDYFERINGIAGGVIHWVKPDSQGYDALLLICGCERACCLRDMPPSGNIVALKHDRCPPEKVIAMLKGKRGS